MVFAWEKNCTGIEGGCKWMKTTINFSHNSVVSLVYVFLSPFEVDGTQPSLRYDWRSLFPNA